MAEIRDAETLLARGAPFRTGATVLVVEETAERLAQAIGLWHALCKYREAYDVASVCRSAVEMAELQVYLQTLGGVPRSWKGVLYVERGDEDTDAEHDGAQRENVLRFLYNIEDRVPVKLVFATRAGALAVEGAYRMSASDWEHRRLEPVNVAVVGLLDSLV